MFSRMARWAASRPMSTWDMEMLHRPAPPKSEPQPPLFLVGLSIGQVAQPTGITIVEKRKSDSAAPASYACRYLQRWLPPHTEYPVLLKELETMLGDARLKDSTLVVEAGPSIKSVLSMLRRHHLPGCIKAVEVRNSAEDRNADGLYKVTKSTLIETTRQVLQQNRLTFDDQMSPKVKATTPPVQAIYQALRSYPYNQKPALNETFASRDGEYDDLVLAVSLACWCGERCQRNLAVHW